MTTHVNKARTPVVATVFRWPAPHPEVGPKIVESFRPKARRPVVQLPDLGSGFEITTRTVDRSGTWIAFPCDGLSQRAWVEHKRADLVREFCEGPVSDQRALSLASKFGFLGEHVHVGELGRNDAFYLPGNPAPKRLRGVNKLVWTANDRIARELHDIRAEPLSAWMAELSYIKFAGSLISALKGESGPREQALSRMIDYDLFCRAYIHDSRGVDDRQRVRHDSDEVRLRPLYRMTEMGLPDDYAFTVDDAAAVRLAGEVADKLGRACPSIVELSTALVRTWLNNKLWNSVTLNLRQDDFGDGTVYRWPKDLIGAVYLALSDWFTGGLRLARTCPECGRTFVPKRKDQVFCHLTKDGKPDKWRTCYTVHNRRKNTKLKRVAERD